MNWFKLVFELLAIAQATIQAVEQAIGAGKPPSAIHAAIVTHMAAAPAIVAAV